MRSGRIAAAVVIVGVGIGLSGCSEPALSNDQYLALVQVGDQIGERDDPGAVWDPLMVSQRIEMGVLLQGLLENWVEYGFPDECFESYAISVGAASDGQQSDDPATQIALFNSAGEVGNHITVGSRTFDSAADAAAFLDRLPEIFAGCPDGFIFDGLQVGDGGFLVDEIDAPDGTRIVRIDGGAIPEGISSRTILIQRGRDVVIIDAFLGFSTLDLGEIDAYGLVLAERLAAIPRG
jgi:hypothetical protein